MLHPDFREHPLTDLTDEEQRKKGRYTLAAAASFIAEKAGEAKPDNPFEYGKDEKNFLQKLFADVRSVKLGYYLPGRKSRQRTAPHDDLSNEFYDFPLELFVQISWNDLNSWLKINEPELDFEFPNPKSDTTPEVKALTDEAPWVQQAKDKADEIYKRDKKLSCDPSKEDIAKEIEREFDGKVLTVKGKRLTAEYILRFGLGKWVKPKL